MRFDVLKLLVFLIAFSTSAIANDVTSNPDLTEIPWENLLNMEVASASKIARQISDAPSAVSVVTSQDIHDYGYRSLADILHSMRGLYVSSDATGYTYLGGRGFGVPGDFTGRIMMLIDGHNVGGNMFNQLFLGNESLLDVELIDRVEYISGPGSTSYGSTAIFGVINIITKKGSSFDGTQLGFGIGSHNSFQTRTTWGKQLENGADILLSASAYKNQGRNIYIPDFDSSFTNNGNFEDATKEHSNRIFLKGSFENWQIELGQVHNISSDSSALGSYELSDFYLKSRGKIDQSFASLRYDNDITKQLKASFHAYLGQENEIHDYFDSVSFLKTKLREKSDSFWNGFDAKFVGTWFEGHQILFGAEYRRDRQRLSDSGLTLGKIYPDNINENFSTSSVYIQDEYQALDNLSFIFGLRYDYRDGYNGIYSPRYAAIYKLSSQSTIKLSYGESFRFENTFDRFNASSLSIFYKPERVATTELIFQHQWDANTNLVGSIYNYELKDAILQNYTKANTTGIEGEIEHVWKNGAHLKTSIARQHSSNDFQGWPDNSPKTVAKFNFSEPLLNRRMRAGLELQYISSRLNFDDSTINGDVLTNLTLTSDTLVPNTDIALTVRNLFDVHAKDVNDTYSYTPIDGTNIWLQFSYNFNKR